MEIQIKNKKLSYVSNKLTKNDNIIKLTSDIDCEFIGVLNISDGTVKSFDFIKEKNYYKGRLRLFAEEIPYLSSTTFYVTMVSNTVEHTNLIPVEVDVKKLSLSIKQDNSREIIILREKISSLENLVKDILNNKTVYSTPLPIVTTNIMPGMIPTAINEEGLCMFKYPFQDVVTEINGQKTVNSAIIITAKDIPIEQTDVESAIKAHTEALKEFNNSLKIISSELKSTKNKVADIEKALLQHTESSIV